MKKVTPGQKFSYWFDNMMAKGMPAMIGLLTLISMILIFVAGFVISWFNFHQDGETVPGFWEAVWESLMRTLDSGTMGGDTGNGFRIVMLVVTIGGIFIVSALIGVLSTGLEDKLNHLRKGRSRVLENLR